MFRSRDCIFAILRNFSVRRACLLARVSRVFTRANHEYLGLPRVVELERSHLANSKMLELCRRPVAITYSTLPEERFMKELNLGKLLDHRHDRLFPVNVHEKKGTLRPHNGDLELWNALKHMIAFTGIRKVLSSTRFSSSDSPPSSSSTRVHRCLRDLYVVTRWSSPTNSSVNSLSTHFPNLQTLKIDVVFNMSNRCPLPRYYRCLPRQLQHLGITVQSKLDRHGAEHLASMITTDLRVLHLKCISLNIGTDLYKAEVEAFKDYHAAQVFWTIIPELTALEDLHAPYFSGNGHQSSTIWNAIVTKVPSLRFARGRYFSEMAPFEILEKHPYLCHIDVSMASMNTDDFIGKPYPTIESLTVVVSPLADRAHARFDTYPCLRDLTIVENFGRDTFITLVPHLFHYMLRSTFTGESIETLTFRNVHVSEDVTDVVHNFVNLSQVNFRCSYSHCGLYGNCHAWLTVDPITLALSLNKCEQLKVINFRFDFLIGLDPKIRWYFKEFTARIRADMLSIGFIELPATKKPWPPKCPQVQRLVVHEVTGVYINGIKQMGSFYAPYYC